MDEKRLLTLMGGSKGFPKSLLNGLVAAYNLNETGGTRYDLTTNNNDLADSSALGYTTGIVGNCPTSTNFAVHFLRSSTITNIPVNADWEASIWVNPLHNHSLVLMLIKFYSKYRTYLLLNLLVKQLHRLTV